MYVCAYMYACMCLVGTKNLHFDESDSAPLMINDFSLLMAVASAAPELVVGLAARFIEDNSNTKENIHIYIYIQYWRLLKCHSHTTHISVGALGGSYGFSTFINEFLLRVFVGQFGYKEKHINSKERQISLWSFNGHIRCGKHPHTGAFDCKTLIRLQSHTCTHTHTLVHTQISSICAVVWTQAAYTHSWFN